MSRRPLTNTFAFDTRCFVCDQDNEGGLRQRFFLDDELNRVVAEFVPSADHSGAPNYAHGGVTMAVLDEAMAWAIIAMKERFGLTRKAEVEFIRPVPIGVAHEVQAWVESFEGRSLMARAELRNPEGKLCVAASASYIVLTVEEAESALGAGAETAARYTEDVE
ncbi:MAG: PaaI family thioesterase [Chloroflexi bacterium]|nr:PaaI family thioesterase [Chloroflexota bacterium]